MDFEGDATGVGIFIRNLRVDIFGEDGMGARAALGSNSLPLNASVEVESIFEIKV